MKRILFILIMVLAFGLRIFKLGQNPPSLYWDEASLGYNAYSIATSLHDEHGEFLPLARFIAFGDYKPPGYVYAIVPWIYLFGLNEFSVRLPSMIAGFLMVVITYFLTLKLFQKVKMALLSSFILAISPWALQFSRAAFEANLAAFFNLTAVYFFVSSQKKKWLILPSVIFFIFSFYTFNANRIIAPLFVIGLLFLYFKYLSKNIKWLLITLIAGIILLFPSISYLSNRESKLRFQEVSIFNNLETIKLANTRIESDNNSTFAKILHNRRFMYAFDFLQHYTDNFTGRFLFTSGDKNPRLSIQDMGEFYIWELPFLLIGLYFLIVKRTKATYVLFFWMLITPIPAATARETPHALRILSILPTFQIIIAYGLYHLVFSLKRGVVGALYFFLFVICFLLTSNIYYYLHIYYIHYPRSWSGEWQYGYKEMVQAISQNQSRYDHILVSDALGRPYIYFAFYQGYPYEKFIQDKVASRDWFGFWDVTALGKIKFNIDEQVKLDGRILIPTTPNNIPNGYIPIQTIPNLSGDVVFVIAEKI